MSVHRIASRYAKSLLDLAVEQNKLDIITEDISSFQRALKNRDLYLLIKSPIINAFKKKQALKALFGGNYDELTMAFLNILATKGREQYLPEVAIEYMHQYKHLKHISEVKLTSAYPLDDKTIEEIRKKLEVSVNTDTHVEIENVVDPELIGGFIVEFEDKIYDASVSKKLDDLRREFSDNHYVSKI